MTTTDLRAAGPDEYPGHDIITDAPTPPQWAIIREIDFRIDPLAAGRELVFFYSRYKRMLAVPTPAAFQTLIRDVCRPNYVFDGGPSNPVQPHFTTLSLDSHDVLAYVIFKLAPGRWQFARKGRPIRIGDAGHVSSAYYSANRVDPLGQADRGDPGVIKDGCQVAYFISDGPGGLASYPHPFNLYIDLLVSGYGPMPIAIDPDVRHPGGSPE